MGKYIIYNPDTTPETTDFLNGVEVESITNQTLYGYLSDDGYEIVPQPKPSIYITQLDPDEGTTEYIDIHTYIDFNNVRTQQWMTDYNITLSETESATAYTCNYSGLEYYVIWEFDEGGIIGTWKVCYAPGIESNTYAANQEDALYIGTFNLVNGTSIDIVKVSPDGWMYDENGNDYKVTQRNKYNYLNIQSTPTKYLFQEKYHNDPTYPIDPEEYVYECTKLPNGKYQKEGIDFDISSETGMYTVFYGGGHNESFKLEEITTGSTIVPVMDSAGTPTSATVSVVFVYLDSNENKIFGAYSSSTWDGKSIFYTGTTMNNLTWYDGGDNIRITFYDYNIITVGGFPSCMAVSEPVPGVAYTPNNGNVYYNRSRIPVFCNDVGQFVYSLGKTMTFNYANCVYLYKLYDVECGGFENLSPNIVERLLIDGVDKTNDYKNGVITDINPYRLQYCDENWNWSFSTEMEITFTDEFFNTGTLNIYKYDCSM